jgi:glutamate N-acetyltransferase/amino-acid N-acetyltransferase|tara:strand:- start:22121 stop:23302 length:1182 start_codon:yes stop_codon:yes gene_type:complete
MGNIKGFKFSGINCGIKKSNKKDLGLILSSTKCIAHAVFTKNNVIAAPLIVSKNTLKKNKIFGVIVNSGNANACTGKKGIESVLKTAKAAANITNMDIDNFFISSTGIIGVPLDEKKIIGSIPKLLKNLKASNIKDFAEAITTTDKYIKIKKANVKIGSKEGTIIGIAKGAGMIHPNMATMLCYLITDIKFESSTFKKYITNATNESFNCISVDGDMSTNDTVLGLSNGLLGNKPINSKSSHGKKIYKTIEEIFYSLSKDIVFDGEGSSKICKVSVKGAKSKKDARKIAEKVSTSLLFKTALFGSDPNWGRIIAAVGATQISYIDQNLINIFLGKKLLVKNGLGMKQTKEIKQLIKRKEIEITVDIKKGKHNAFMLTNDLGHEYVNINSLYTT